MLHDLLLAVAAPALSSCKEVESTFTLAVVLLFDSNVAVDGMEVKVGLIVVVVLIVVIAVVLLVALSCCNSCSSCNFDCGGGTRTHVLLGAVDVAVVVAGGGGIIGSSSEVLVLELSLDDEADTS